MVGAEVGASKSLAAEPHTFASPRRAASLEELAYFSFPMHKQHIPEDGEDSFSVS